MVVNIKKVLFLLVLSLVTTSCAFVPEVDKDQGYAKQCDMVTRKLNLASITLGHLDCGVGSGGDEACLAAIGVAIPAVTLVVSGSIVVIGNTLHWVEYQGTCESGYVSQYVKIFKEKLY